MEEKTSYTMAELYDLETPVLVRIEDKQIGLLADNYWIELDRIKTRAALLEWVHHLLGKNWVTKEMLEQFIEQVHTYRKWKLYNDV